VRLSLGSLFPRDIEFAKNLTGNPTIDAQILRRNIISQGISSFLTEQEVQSILKAYNATTIEQVTEQLLAGQMSPLKNVGVEVGITLNALVEF